MFESIFKDGSVAATSFFIVLLSAFVCGVIYSFLSCYKTKSSKSFLVATAMIPMAVAMVITLVNGNLGIGVAIAGAFGLVRFRSAPGSAKEIAVIFIGMAGGLAFGMGYLAYGAIFLIVCGILLFIYERVFGKPTPASEKIVKITIPESLDYTNVFDEIFNTYTTKHELIKVKSTNMGSMFRLVYHITLRDANEEKKFIDAIRVRNGNLEIQVSRVDVEEMEL